MNELELLRKLGAAAGRNEAPSVDVAGRVLRDIQGRQSQAPALLSTLAALSSSAAVVAGVLAWQAWAEYFDPFNRLFSSFIVGMQ